MEPIHMKGQQNDALAREWLDSPDMLAVRERSFECRQPENYAGTEDLVFRYAALIPIFNRVSMVLERGFPVTAELREVPRLADPAHLSHLKVLRENARKVQIRAQDMYLSVEYDEGSRVVLAETNAQSETKAVLNAAVLRFDHVARVWVGGAVKDAEGHVERFVDPVAAIVLAVVDALPARGDARG